MSTIKNSQTKLGQSLNGVIPLVEEIIKAKSIPICLIGARINNKKEKRIGLYFATMNDSDECEKLVYEAAKVLVAKLKDKYEPEI